MGYPPGVRENGGQYTHAALWVAMAFARMGEGRRAVEILQMLNPIEHGFMYGGALHTMTGLGTIDIPISVIDTIFAARAGS